MALRRLVWRFATPAGKAACAVYGGPPRSTAEVRDVTFER